jgi:integrase
MAGSVSDKKSKGDHLPGKLAPVVLRKLPDGWHADGGNLYLFVRGFSRSWVFRYTSPDVGKLRRNMGLGSLEAVSLARARDLAREYRAMVKDPKDPVDPMTLAEAEKTARDTAAGKMMTFRDCADAYLEINRSTWANAKHAQQWTNTLKTYAYPLLGDLPVSAVDTSLVSKCLLPIWKSKTETATRLRGRIESILDWAKVSGFREGENPARWRGHLDKLLPAPKKLATVVHHPALPYSKIGGFINELRSKEGIGARALEFTILTAARSGEVRGATWDEISLEKREWIIPAGRMKMRRNHKVPLSDATIGILKDLPKTESAYIFPGSKVNAPMSDMTLTKVIRRMGDRRTTVHGFRSTFRDWAAEITAYSREVAEMALAHSIGNAVEEAYRRGDLLEKRRRLMEDWSKYCNTVVSAEQEENLYRIHKGRKNGSA